MAGQAARGETRQRGLRCTARNFSCGPAMNSGQALSSGGYASLSPIADPWVWLNGNLCALQAGAVSMHVAAGLPGSDAGENAV